ncbi:hypothetical protein EB796_021052 [Bugula neritina]|uniref:Uncharacterized protein n=1 Tax=Bugula neritina TaxID=10212 RepID=A0A7J7J3D5_BUGNE|nr:hypothetical protein EB796_021052 [Bugula neritina]
MMREKPDLHQKLRKHQGVYFQLISRVWTGNRKYGSGELSYVIMFFLMHLRNKPDTEYTGQETYVWEMYNNRCWDFFPVGDCFRKQYNSDETTS